MKTSIGLMAGGAVLALAAIAGAAASGLVPVPAWAHATHAPVVAANYMPIGWAKLMPEAWLKRFRALNYGQMNDGDPRVGELLHEVETSWDSAPTVAELDGRAVKIPGYIVPLEQVKGELSEFLLVPYLGACIHTPPPPANQIVHVKSSTPLKGLHSMDIVSISGTLKVAHESSAMGVSGYAMDAVLVEPYVAPARASASKGEPPRQAVEASKTNPKT